MSGKTQKKVWNNLYESNFSWHLESKLPKVCKGKKVLELGVGTGKTLQSIINQLPKEVHAVDFSEEAISICKAKFNSSLVNMHLADITSLPFKDHSFDIVVCFFVLNNLTEKERKEAVSEIHRVLKKQGIVIFQDFALGDYRYSSFNKRETSKEERFCHFFTILEIKRIFSKFKLKKLEIIESNPIRKSQHLKRRFIFGIFNLC